MDTEKMNNPWMKMYEECGRKRVNVCRLHHLQMCHLCERIECHDNHRLLFTNIQFSPGAIKVRSIE
jgi:hypothetical protein